MEKTEQITKTIIDTTHHFYCDDCNIYLGSSQEYDDGYYVRFGEFELKFYLPDGWYKLKKCLCEDCKQECLEDITDRLKYLGFVKES